MKYSSQLIENAVNAFARLPGVGKKSAIRMVLQLIQNDPEGCIQIAESLVSLKRDLKRCRTCCSYSDHDICEICNSTVRDKHTVCVVESIRDVMAIEETDQFNGLYHVLGGVISPIDGIGPGDINIDSLLRRIKEEEVTELIMGLSPTIEGETTIFYISKQLKDTNTKVSILARGIAFGGELEYADGLTLGRSILSRTNYQYFEE